MRLLRNQRQERRPVHGNLQLSFGQHPVVKHALENAVEQAGDPVSDRHGGAERERDRQVRRRGRRGRLQHRVHPGSIAGAVPGGDLAPRRDLRRPLQQVRGLRDRSEWRGVHRGADRRERHDPLGRQRRLRTGVPHKGRHGPSLPLEVRRARLLARRSGQHPRRPDDAPRRDRGQPVLRPGGPSDGRDLDHPLPDPAARGHFDARAGQDDGGAGRDEALPREQGPLHHLGGDGLQGLGREGARGRGRHGPLGRGCCH
mmetsp:Transcript_37229/g.88064  ORF Transcript_37229/g.88064 Transcript_37229/m.88064 type:complete len:257 (+) Transcript_37229:822-1592(+)